MRELIRLLDMAYSCLKSEDETDNFEWEIDYHYNQARLYLVELAKVNRALGYPAKNKYFKRDRNERRKQRNFQFIR